MRCSSSAAIASSSTGKSEQQSATCPTSTRIRSCLSGQYDKKQFWRNWKVVQLFSCSGNIINLYFVYLEMFAWKRSCERTRKRRRKRRPCRSQIPSPSTSPTSPSSAPSVNREFVYTDCKNSNSLLNRFHIQLFLTIIQYKIYKKEKTKIFSCSKVFC